MNKIDKFDGQYDFCSNFYYCSIVYDDIEYEHSEAAFQAQKTLDEHIRQVFAKMMLTPGQAKRAGKGREFKTSDGTYAKIELRPDWEKVKNSIMYEIVRAKFEQNADIREKLLATGDAQLVEGNYWHDNYWGQCTCARCANIVGFNQLGKTLMRVRAELGGAPYNEPWNANYIGVQKQQKIQTSKVDLSENTTAMPNASRCSIQLLLKPPCYNNTKV